jgi:hypothetical protein
LELFSLGFFEVLLTLYLASMFYFGAITGSFEIFYVLRRTIAVYYGTFVLLGSITPLI